MKKKYRKYIVVYARPNRARYIKSFDTIEECVKYVTKHTNLIGFRRFNKNEHRILIEKLFSVIQKEQKRKLLHYKPDVL